MKQRILDWLLERRIRRFGRLALRAFKAGDHEAARAHWACITDDINARSPEQVARMERRLGLSE